MKNSEQDKAIDGKIAEEDFVLFLKIMGYIRENEEDLARSVWSMVQVDETNSITRRSLRMILFGIHNIWEPKWMLQPSS